MNVTLDLLLTVALSASLFAGGGVALWLLPWSDADRAATTRALASMARRLGDGARMPARAVLAGR